eukprot:TRINITY_DN75615_c0_g1_i1.p2 TRINITY_DN75615_c0_g1~~TRINITY_DN75615_c0_g1_i1.p2  ORF type:complete len:296 (+),score=54.64 TRINITY_DN75615_c0_g1_i1:98-889(+)
MVHAWSGAAALLQLHLPRWTDAFFVSLTMVGVAEVFDKTWFVALVMALRHDRNTVFWGCFAGLALHVPIAAVFGYSLTKAFSPQSLDMMAACLYGVMAVLYTWDWYTTEKGADIFAAGREEANEAIAGQPADGERQPLSPAKAKAWSMRNSVFFQCFMAVFIAEWGDRTQIAMVGLHASQPLYPVMAGSLVAFFFLTISAIIVAFFLAEKELSERTVKAVVAMSFVAFTIWSLHDALRAHAAESGATTGASHTHSPRSYVRTR